MPPSDRPSKPIIGTTFSLDGPRLAAAGCGLLVTVISLLALAGWATDTTLLKTVMPGWNAMQPLTALAFVCAGAALLLAISGRGPVQLVLIGVMVAIAGSALIQAPFGSDLGVDTLLFRDRVSAQVLRYPGRMAEATAIGFLVFGASLALSRQSGRGTLIAIMASLGLVLAGIGLVGYLFGSSGLARYGSYSSMAVHTATCFLLLFLSILSLRAEDTWMSTLLSARVGGVVARRMVPGVVGLPLVVGLIVTRWSGLWGTPAATAVGMAMVAVITGLAIMVLWMARAMNTVEEGSQMVGRAFRRAEARYRSVVDTAVDAMVVIDEAGIIQSFNRAAQTMFGLTPEQAIGRNVAILMPEPHSSHHDDYIRSYLTTGAARIIGIGREVEGRRADGTLFPLDLAIAEWRDEGQRFFTGIMRDISARRASDQRLREAKEAAEKANRDKSRFLAAASHDLRQPVQAMVLMASVMADQLRGHPAERLMANTVLAIDALQSLLSGLLDVSRLDAGVVRPEPREFALNGLIERLAAEYRLLAAEKGVALHAVRCTAIVRTDATLLERILRNLLENAVRYTEHGGIVIGCRRRGGEAVAVQVVDSGIGIAAEDCDAVFQEFYQVGNPERDRTKGLGLGLSIVSRLTALLGLRLGMRSVPGRGTSFSVELPVVGRQPAPEPAEGLETAALKGVGTIMVIDDEPMVRVGIGSILSSWGYEVALAEDAEDAVAWVKAHGRRCPGLILADYRLRDGHTGTNAVREVHLACGQKVPAVIITGDTAPENIAEVTRSGFAIAHKPVAPERLRQLVATAGG